VADKDVWTDLLDPSEDELADAVAAELHGTALQILTRTSQAGAWVRIMLETHGTYILGVLLVPVSVPEEDRVFYQEVDLVVTRDRVVTIRKTPSDDDPPFDRAELEEACSDEKKPALVLYRVLDAIAERYLELMDSLEDEVDELEDGVETWSSARVRRRISELRHGMLHVRRAVAPTRDAVRRVVDGRLELEDVDAFGTELRIEFGDVYDKLLRATEGLDVARELLSSARDYHQSKVAESQNDVVKKLTVIASLLLLPTLVVGIYGQNFDRFPELHWRLGYAFSWALIVGSTLVQLGLFRWRRWI
jgi:magnesium transporter